MSVYVNGHHNERVACVASAVPI